MDELRKPKDDECPADQFVKPGGRDIQVQLVVSLALGISAFVAFSVSLRRSERTDSRGVRLTGATQVLRPKWKSLYSARKRRYDAGSAPPNLPDSLFGWIPTLYKITDEQILSSAGLDAYVARFSVAPGVAPGRMTQADRAYAVPHLLQDGHPNLFGNAVLRYCRPRAPE